MNSVQLPIDKSSAHAFLARLAARGITTVFANAGTDFAPLIEAMSWQAGTGTSPYPRFIIVPHENLAMAMANGYYRVTGRMAAVMVHVSVGTANTLCQLMNMHRDQVPVLLCAGRSPSTEQGHIASRSAMIHWGQETYDQGGMVREFVKWDYELRAGQPVTALVDRAVDVAMSEPRGPVYLSLPRELLADPATAGRVPLEREFRHFDPSPSGAAMEQVADLVAAAQFPLILTSALGRTADEANVLSALAEDHALPVAHVWATDVALTSDHPMNLGYGEGLQELLDKADVVLAVRCATPWIPCLNHPQPDARIVTIDSDPHRLGYPFVEREADISIEGSACEALRLLHHKLGERKAYPSRRDFAETFRRRFAAARASDSQAGRRLRPLDAAWFADCINKAKSPGAVIVNELGARLSHLDITQPLSYIGSSAAGGLGSGLGAALGAKVGAPEREVIVVVGDGSYMFGNPLPYHYVQRAEGLPILTIVANNHSWLAVKESTLGVYPQGHAAAMESMPLQSLSPSPAFEMVAQSCGGFGLSVDDPEDLPAALEEALAKVRAGTPALLNVHTRSR